MDYCVIKNTTTVIDGSENEEEIMLENARNAGYTENEVEILTEEEYKTRVLNIPKPPQPPTTDERLAAVEEALLMII
jgi:hypothetical protein